MPSFQEALDAKADVLEFDLQLTKDDVPVVSHDPLLTKQHCVDAEGKPLVKSIPVRTLTLAELKTYDCGSVRQERFPKQKLIPGTRIPTLEEVLQFVTTRAPHLRMNIETKMVPPSDKELHLVPKPALFVEKIVALLRKYGVVEKSILQSFDFRTLTEAKKAEPRLALSCLFEKEADYCGETLRIGAQWLSPLQTLLTPAVVKDCHAKGIKVVPWTANTPDEWARLVDLKVDAIISDYPRQLVEFLKSR